jgi:hypothetical protein
MRQIVTIGLATIIVGTALFFAFGRAASSSGSAFPAGQMNRTPIAGSTAKVTHATLVGSSGWSMKSFTNERGEFCAGPTGPAEDGRGTGQALTCRDRTTLFNDHDLVYFVGAQRAPGKLATWDNLVVWGFASPKIQRLELQLTNCATIPLRVDADRLFLHAFGASTIHGGVGPQQLIGYDATGAVVDSQPTPVSAPTSRSGASGTAPVRAAC